MQKGYSSFPVARQTTRGESKRNDRRQSGSDDPAILLAAIIPTFLTLGAIPVQLQTHDIQVGSAGFRIYRLFYSSPWLHWQHIKAIQQHGMSSRLQAKVVVTAEAVSSCYSIERDRQVGLAFQTDAQPELDSQ